MTHTSGQWADDTVGAAPSSSTGGLQQRFGEFLISLGLLLLLFSLVLSLADTERSRRESLEFPPVRPQAVQVGYRLSDIFQDPTPIVLLTDLSASMAAAAPNASEFGSKWTLVKAGVASFLNQLPEQTKVGVRVFGQSTSVCAPSELLRDPRPLGPDGAADIAASLSKLTPEGDTPLAQALEAAAEDLGPSGGEIILLSDGADTCVGLNGVCASARSVAARGIPVRIDLVRMFMPEMERRALSCVSEATGGSELDLLNPEPAELAGLLRGAVPLRIGIALALILFGWLTFFPLCDLFAEALGWRGILWGRAGLASDVLLAAVALAWATFWLRHVVHVPLAVAVVAVGLTLGLAYRQIPRRRAAIAADLEEQWDAGQGHRFLWGDQ